MKTPKYKLGDKVFVLCVDFVMDACPTCGVGHIETTKSYKVEPRIVCGIRVTEDIGNSLVEYRLDDSTGWLSNETDCFPTEDEAFVAAIERR
jgi:outer membrane phospholipase A